MVQADCGPVAAYRVWLREGTRGSPLLMYEGHPGGGFSTADALTVDVNVPHAPPATADYSVAIGARRRAPTLHQLKYQLKYQPCGTTAADSPLPRGRCPGSRCYC